ncbi:hypothetical protein OAS86_03000 [Gammaproteobacteria bacterium]|nr:hypothetical protein [Gammaproteobacteria bacterium]
MRSKHPFLSFSLIGLLLASLMPGLASASECTDGDLADEPTNFDQLWTHVSGTLDVGTRILFAKTERVVLEGQCQYVFSLKYMAPTGLIYWRSYHAQTLRSVEIAEGQNDAVSDSEAAGSKKGVVGR